MNLGSRDVVFAVNVGKIGSTRADKRIFQIAYDDRLRLMRAELLRNLSYPVTSVVGNEAAKVLLTTLRTDNVDIALFIVGHAAPAQRRKEMVDWLKANYPESTILVLNPPNEQVLGADYNVLQNGPEAWLPLVGSTMSSHQVG